MVKLKGKKGSWSIHLQKYIKYINNAFSLAIVLQLSRPTIITNNNFIFLLPTTHVCPTNLAREVGYPGQVALEGDTVVRDVTQGATPLQHVALQRPCHAVLN